MKKLLSIFVLMFAIASLNAQMTMVSTQETTSTAQDVGVLEQPANDLQLVANSPFLVTQVPVLQAVGQPFPTIIPAQAQNIGTAIQTNVRFTATFNGINLGTSTVLESLESGAPAAQTTMTLEQTVVTAYPTTAGTFNLVLTLEQAESPANPSGQHTATFPLVVGNIYALDALDFSVPVHSGIAPTGQGNAANVGVGNVFEIHTPTTMTGVQVGFAEDDERVGSQFIVGLYRMSAAGTRVTTPIHRTATQARPIGGLVNIAFPETVLMPGSYFIAVTPLATGGLRLAADPRPNAMRARSVNNLTIAAVGTQTAIGAAAVRMVVDETMPLPVLLMSRYPAIDARDIALDADIVLYFHENITAGDLSQIAIDPPVGNIVPTIVDNRLIIAHDGFTHAQSYTVTIPAGTIADFDEVITWTFRAEPLCQPVTTFPWSENFDAVFFRPDCWVIHSENAALAETWLRNTSAALRPGSTAQARHNAPPTAAAAQTSWLITPAITLPATGIYELAFWTRWMSPVSNRSTGVWISTTNNDITSFHELHDLNAPVTAWTEIAISLEEFAGETIYLAFRYQSNESGIASTSWDIDDVVVHRAPVRVISLTPENNTYEVDVTQDIVVGFNQDVMYTDLSAITISPAAENPVIALTDSRTLTITHDGLAHAARHTVTIPAGTIVGLDQQTAWQFRTIPLCVPRTVLPWVENFNEPLPLFPPDCWTIHRENLEVLTWARNTSSPRPGGVAHARHDAPPIGNDVQTSWLITEAVSIPTTDIHELVFWTRWGTPANNYYTGVWISTTDRDIASFRELLNLNSPINAWTEIIVSLEELAGETIYFAFKYVGRGVNLSSTSWDIEDVSVNVAPIRITSTTPINNMRDVELNQDIIVKFNRDVTYTDLSAITISPAVENIVRNFTDNRTLVISHDGFEYATTHTVTIPAGTIDGLNETFSWSFRAEPFCEPVTTFPWVEDFNNAALFPSDCWRVHRENLQVPAWERNTAVVRPGGVAHARQTAPVQAADVQTSWLITEAIKLPETAEHELTFWTRWQGMVDNYYYTGVWISTTNRNIESFQELQEVPITVPATWVDISISLEEFAGETIYLAFKYIGRGPGLISVTWDIEDVTIDLAPVRISSQIPADNATYVATYQDIVVTFNQNVTYTDLSQITVVPTLAGLNVSLVDNTLTITHDGFAFATEYTVTIPSGTIVGFDEEISWSFEVEPVIERVEVEAIGFGTEFASSVTDPDGTEIIRVSAINTSNRAITATDIITINLTLTGDVTFGETRTLSDLTVAINDVFFVDFGDLGLDAAAPAEFTASATATFMGAENSLVRDLVAHRTGDDTGIQISATTAVVVIYPNPVDDILHIQTTEAVRRIEIFNVQGALVMTVDGNATAINVSNLPSGAYMIRFVTETGVSIQRFVKR